MLGRQAVASRGPAGAGVARLVDAHAALRRHPVDVRDERDHIGAVRIGRVDHQREAEIGRQPAAADVGPALARVVGAVHAAVELHEEAPRPGRCALDVVDAAACVLVGQRLLRQVARVEAGVAAAPAAPAVVAQPDPGRRDRHGEAVRIARPGADRVQAEAAAAGLPAGARGLLPEPGVDLPRRAAVGALEEDARVSPRVEDAVAGAAGDHPDPLERLLGALGQLDAVRLLPLAGGIAVGVEDLRPVERGGDAGQQPPAARIAQREVDRLPGERARRDLELRPRLPREQEDALLRANHQLRHLIPPVIAGSTSTRSSAPTTVASPPRSPLTNTLM